MVRRVKDWNWLLRDTVKSPSLSNLSYKLSNRFQTVSTGVHPAVGRRVSGQHQTSPPSSLPKFYSARPTGVHYVFKITPKFTSWRSKSWNEKVCFNEILSTVDLLFSYNIATGTFYGTRRGKSHAFALKVNKAMWKLYKRDLRSEMKKELTTHLKESAIFWRLDHRTMFFPSSVKKKVYFGFYHFM